MDHQDNRATRLEILKQFLRFNVVGVLNTALTYGIYSGLVALGLHHLAAVGVEYVFGIVFSYLMNKRFTFTVRGRAGSRMFLRMIVAYVPMLLLNALLLWLLVDRLHWNKYAGQAVALSFVSALSFTAQRRFVFRGRKEMANGQ